MVLGKLDIQTQRMKLYPYHTPSIKINQKWIKTSVWTWNCKYPRRKEGKFIGIGLDDDFIDTTLKEQIKKARIDKWTMSN